MDKQISLTGISVAKPTGFRPAPPKKLEQSSLPVAAVTFYQNPYGDTLELYFKPLNLGSMRLLNCGSIERTETENGIELHGDHCTLSTKNSEDQVHIAIVINRNKLR